MALSFIGEESEYPEKTADPPKITDKLYHIMLHLALSEIRSHH